jgi:hypothetical protein
MRSIIIGFLFFANLSFAQSWRVEGNSGKITRTGDGTYTLKYYNRYDVIKTYYLTRTYKEKYQIDCGVGTYDVYEVTYMSDDEDYYFVILWSFACDGKLGNTYVSRGLVSPICYEVGIIKMYDGLDNLINEFTIECDD